MKHDLNRLKSGGGQEGAAAAARGQGRQSNQSESEQLEKAVASVRQCHSKMFALKSGAGSIIQDGLTPTDRKELVGAIDKLEDLFGAYGTMKNTKTIPGESKPTTSTMIFRKIKEDKQLVRHLFIKLRSRYTTHVCSKTPIGLRPSGFGN